MPAGFLSAMILMQPMAAPPQSAASLPAGQLVSLALRKGTGGELCTAGSRWCVFLAEPTGDGEPPLPVVRAGGTGGPSPHAFSEEAYSNETHGVWPNLIILKDGGFLAGVETRVSTAYSGGGGSATDLRLFRVSADGRAAPGPVLNVQVAGSLLIRACFGERDMAKRRGACHDEYVFSGSVTLASGPAATLPNLVYVTRAKAFPRGVSRLEDSTTKSRLKKSDLVFEQDAACSFSRRLRFDGAAGAYAPDRPLPDCSAYTVP